MSKGPVEISTFHIKNLAPLGGRDIDLHCEEQDYCSAMTLAVATMTLILPQSVATSWDRKY